MAFHLGHEADHSPPYSAEVKEWVELYLHFPNTPSWRCAQLGGAQGQLYYFIINVKDKVVPVLLSGHHPMKAYCGSGGIDPRTLDLGIRWR
jgi:hypothetical protein